MSDEPETRLPVLPDHENLPVEETDSSGGLDLPPEVEIGPEDEEVLQRFWLMVRRLPRYGRLAANLARDETVPSKAKAALVGGGSYLVSPIDLIPGIVPVLGQLDDLVVLLLALRYAVNRCPEDVAVAQMERVGLARSDLDEDLEAVRITILWLGGKGVEAAGRIAKSGLRSSTRAVRWGLSRARTATTRR